MNLKRDIPQLCLFSGQDGCAPSSEDGCPLCGSNIKSTSFQDFSVHQDARDGNFGATWLPCLEEEGFGSF